VPLTPLDRDRALAPRPLRVAAAWSWRLLVVGAAVLIAVYALARVQVVVLPVLGALLVCTFLGPPAAWLRRRGLPPALAAVSVMAAAAATLGGLGLAIWYQVSQDVEDLDVSVDEGIGEVQRWLVEGPLGMERARVEQAVDDARAWFTSPDGLLASGVLDRALTAIEVVTGAVLALILVFFFLKDGGRMWDWLVRRLGPDAGGHVHEAGGRAWWALGGYMRGQAIVAAVDAVFIGLAIFLLGVPFALPLAVLTFFAAFLPIVGAFVAGAVAVLVALASQGPVTALILLAVIVAVQQIEGNVLAPVVMARTARLHPVVVLVALGAGGAVGGIVGAFLAVPIAAAVAAVGGYVWPRVGPEGGEPGESPDSSPGAEADRREVAAAPGPRAGP
jgi:predicted PurR-regulated permease PerM